MALFWRILAYFGPISPYFGKLWDNRPRAVPGRPKPSQIRPRPSQSRPGHPKPIFMMLSRHKAVSKSSQAIPTHPKAKNPGPTFEEALEDFLDIHRPLICLFGGNWNYLEICLGVLCCIQLLCPVLTDAEEIVVNYTYVYYTASIF